MPRWLITILLLVGAVVVVWALAQNINKPAPSSKEEGQTPATTTDSQSKPGTAPAPVPPTSAAALPAQPVEPIEGLHVLPVDKQEERTIGRVEFGPSNPFPFEVKLTPWGAGVVDLRLSQYATQVAKPEDREPYPLQKREARGDVAVYPMAARAVVVNGVEVQLETSPVRWQVVSADESSVTFSVTIADGLNKPVLRITRKWHMTARGGEKQAYRYALGLDQRFENLSDKPLEVRFIQYGPVDLRDERSYIGDYRHVVLAYQQPRRQSDVTFISTEGYDTPRDKVIGAEYAELWPDPEAEPGRSLMWAAMSNRYFAAVMHLPSDPAKPSAAPLQTLFPTVRRVVWGAGKPDRQSLTMQLESRPLRLSAAGAQSSTASLDVELYAGPKSPDILNTDPAYKAMGLGQTIVYNLGGCCATCTFSWLANGLFTFMSFIHDLVRDWGVAIIFLVAVVRLILHPLTKSSQVNMMKLSKQMQTLQPEMEKLKAKYKDNQPKLNSEMMQLYREKGVNPAAMGLGCLPMVLQMPIWFALYAMLYFAIELRHQPAFWGLFQKISGGAWHFLADLSSQDHFITFPQVSLGFFTLESINILPLLMGVVFFIQQKYMTAPSPNMSPEMKQQQAMMKWMTTLMMPVFLYKAPSGLTLYILTSTAVGIWESRRVRAHVKELEDSGKLHEKKPVKPGSLMDRLHKAFEARRKLIEEQMKQQQKRERK